DAERGDDRVSGSGVGAACVYLSLSAVLQFVISLQSGSLNPQISTALLEKDLMNIYVGNLSYRTTEDELRTAFEAYGAVSSTSIIRDRDSGQSKGFGFVEMPSDSEAQAAIDGLNDKEVGGRRLKVNQARPREDSGGGR